MRPDPLAPLARRLSGLAAQRPGFALTLCGEAGVGKSFALQRLLGNVPCAVYTASAMRDPAELLRALPRPPHLSRLLEASLGRLNEGGVLPLEATLSTLANLLAKLAPVVLYIEDLHDAAPQRLVFWTQLAVTVQTLRGVALICSSRTAPPPGFETLNLERLPPEDARQLLETELHAPLPSPAMEWIYERAAGNPLYSLEYVRLLARQGLLWSDGQTWRWRSPPDEVMPVSVEALIERKLRDAAPGGPARALLDALALCPPERAEALKAASGLDEDTLSEVHRQLTAQGVLTTDEVAKFAHPLYRELTLKTLSAGLKRTMARRGIAVLEGHDPEGTAWLVDAAELDALAALTLLAAAAAAQEANGERARAGQLLARALKYTSGEERGRLALRASRLLESGAVAEAFMLAEQAADALPDDPEAVLHLAKQRVFRSRKLSDGEALLDRLSPEVQQGVQVRLARMQWGLLCGDFAGTLALWRAYPESERTAESDYFGGAALTRTAADPVQGEARLRSALSGDLPATTRISTLNLLSLVQREQGDQDAAEQTLKQAIELAQQPGMELQTAMCLQNYALALSHTERYSEMKEAIERSIAAYARAGEPQRALAVQQMLGNRLFEEGRFAETEVVLLECREGLRGAGPSAFLLVVEAELLRVYLAWNHPPARILAERFAASVVEQAQALGPLVQVGSYAYIQAVRVEARWGSPTRARELIEQVKQIYTHPPQSLELMRRGALGELAEAEGNAEQAAEHFAAAADLAAAEHLTLDEQLYRLELDRLKGDLASARERFDWFEVRGRGLGTALARRYFPELEEQGSKIASHSTFELSALGILTLGGVVVRGKRRQELLLTLLETRLAGLPGVRTLDLLEALYPGIAEDSALGALKQTVFKLRSQHGAGCVTTTSQGYALGGSISDAERFLQQGDLTLWRGLYADGDRPLPRALVMALKSAISSALSDEPLESARTAQLLLEHDPYDVESLQLCCQALQAAGQTQLLKRIYGKSRGLFLEVGEGLPTQWQVFLKEVLSG